MDICGMKEPLTFEFQPYVDPPQNLLSFLRLLNMSGPDAFHLEALFRNEIEDHLNYPISPENEENLCESMIAGCEQALEAYRRLKNTDRLTPRQSLMIQASALRGWGDHIAHRIRSALGLPRRAGYS